MNVRFADHTVASFVSLDERSICTLLVGSESSTIVYVDVPPFSVVVDHVLESVYQAVSSSVIVTRAVSSATGS